MDPHADPLRAADQVALHWLGESGEAELYTFDGLEDQVRRAAAVFRAAGVGEGDAVLLFLPAMPEAVIATLVCERLGARALIEAEAGPQGTVPGFGAAAALRERIRAERPRVVVTATRTQWAGPPAGTGGGIRRWRAACPGSRRRRWPR